MFDTFSRDKTMLLFEERVLGMEGGGKLHNALLHDTALATIYIMSLQRGKNMTMTTAGVAGKGRESCNVTTSAFPR